MNKDMAAQAAHKDGFIAALDQSGGSTPKALELYGIDDVGNAAAARNQRGPLVEQPVLELSHVVVARVARLKKLACKRTGERRHGIGQKW